MLADISNAENIYDDILIHAVTQEEQDATLIRVLQHFQDCGLTFGRKKCEFSKESIKFFGVIFSNKGQFGFHEFCQKQLAKHRRHGGHSMFYDKA